MSILTGLIGSNSYEKEKTLKYLGSLLTNKNSIQEEIKCNLKQEIHVIIESKHSCLLDFYCDIFPRKEVVLITNSNLLKKTCSWE